MRRKTSLYRPFFQAIKFHAIIVQNGAAGRIVYHSSPEPLLKDGRVSPAGAKRLKDSKSIPLILNFFLFQKISNWSLSPYLSDCLPPDILHLPTQFQTMLNIRSVCQRQAAIVCQVRVGTALQWDTHVMSARTPLR